MPDEVSQKYKNDFDEYAAWVQRLFPIGKTFTWLGVDIFVTKHHKFDYQSSCRQVDFQGYYADHSGVIHGIALNVDELQLIAKQHE